MPIFCVKSVKIYTGQKKFTRVYPWRLWQISGTCTIAQCFPCTATLTNSWSKWRHLEQGSFHKHSEGLSLVAGSCWRQLDLSLWRRLLTLTSFSTWLYNFQFAHHWLGKDLRRLVEDLYVGALFQDGELFQKSNMQLQQHGYLLLFSFSAVTSQVGWKQNSFCFLLPIYG